MSIYTEMEQLNDMVKKIPIQLLFCSIIAILSSSLFAEENNTHNRSHDKDHCVICHEQQTKKSLKDPVAEWRASVHAGKEGACNLCHRGDPGAEDKIKAKSRLANFIGRPNKKKMPEFCGRKGCHETSLEQFKEGPHYQSAAKTGEPGCTTCHGVHSIQSSSFENIRTETCNACHSQKYARETVAFIAGLGKRIATIDNNVAVMVEKHIDVKVIQERLARVHTVFNRFIHVLSRQEMDSTRNILETEITSIENDMGSRATSIQRIDALYVIMVAFCLLVIVGFFIYIIIMYSRRKK